WADCKRPTAGRKTAVFPRYWGCGRCKTGPSDSLVMARFDIAGGRGLRAVREAGHTWGKRLWTWLSAVLGAILRARAGSFAESPAAISLKTRSRAGSVPQVSRPLRGPRVAGRRWEVLSFPNGGSELCGRGRVAKCAPVWGRASRAAWKASAAVSRRA